MTFAITNPELVLLREIRDSDEDHGGLAWEELSADDLESVAKLCSLGLVEACGEYGEAPDGEEDERDAGGQGLMYRITGLGVRAVHDSS